MTQVLTDCTIWVNQFDVTADVTQSDIADEFVEVDSTTFGSNRKKERKAGIESGQIDVMSFWDPALIEGALKPLEGTSGNVLAVTTDGAFEDVAYFVNGTILKTTTALPVGGMAKFDTGVAGSGTVGVMRGHLLAPKATRTATGSGTARQEGAVIAGQRVYALAQVFSVAGTSTPTLTLKVQSDDNSGFTSATDRITFTDFTAAGFQLSSLAGAITDDYWRVTWTITGTSPQFSFAVCLGID